MAESKEQSSSRPPSYTETDTAPVAEPQSTDPAPVAAPAYTGPALQQTMQLMPQGGLVSQQGYVIQNVPVPEQTGCCGGRSDKFKHKAGVTTGIIHLLVAIVSIALSVCTFVFMDKVDGGYYGMGRAIGGSVIFFIPAGILGILTKAKSNCVIVSYMVMTILSAIQAVYVMGVEIPAAIFSSYKYIPCPYPDYFIDDVIEPYDAFPQRYYDASDCGEQLVVCLLIIHIALAVVSFIEFISAIVGAAYCCGGLRCCCAQASPQQSTTMMYYTPVGQPQAAPGTGQVAVQVSPAASAEAGALPQKA